MNSIGRFLNHFRRLGLRVYDVGGMGHVIMDRLFEEGFPLRRINNGSPAKRSDIYTNLSAEWWSEVGQLIERRQIIIPDDEKLIGQLTSRRRLYDSRGREKLESKADMRSRGLESPDLADAVVGAVMLNRPGQGGAIGERELAGIQFGGSRRLFGGEVVSFEEGMMIRKLAANAKMPAGASGRGLGVNPLYVHACWLTSLLIQGWLLKCSPLSRPGSVRCFLSIWCVAH